MRCIVHVFIYMWIQRQNLDVTPEHTDVCLVIKTLGLTLAMEWLLSAVHCKINWIDIPTKTKLPWGQTQNSAQHIPLYKGWMSKRKQPMIIELLNLLGFRWLRMWPWQWKWKIKQNLSVLLACPQIFAHPFVWVCLTLKASKHGYLDSVETLILRDTCTFRWHETCIDQLPSAVPAGKGKLHDTWKKLSSHCRD